MEYLPLGDLSKHISEDIEEHDLKDISSQLLEGLKLMHSKGFAHRDLKPQNIFVFQKQPSWWVKIGDFGIAKRVRDCDATELRTTTGTQGYEAPEIRGYVEVDEANPSSVYTKVVDIWSLGCVVYKVVANRVPFRDGREIRKFCYGKNPFPVQPLVGKLSTNGIEFLQSVLVKTPDARPTADIALQHPWFACSEDQVDSISQTSPNMKQDSENVRNDLNNPTEKNMLIEFWSPSGLPMDYFRKADLLRHEGDTAMLKGNYPAAVSFYTVALRHLPGSAVLLSNRAAAYCALKEPAFAEVDAKAAVESKSFYSLGWARLGYVRNQMYDVVGSWEAYQRAIESGGDTDAIKSGYAMLEDEIDLINRKKKGFWFPARVTLLIPELDSRPLSMEQFI